MHPTAQISMDYGGGMSNKNEDNFLLTLVYILKESMISGARYQRVATYSVISPTSLPPGALVFTLRARPKSQTLRSQLAFNKRLAGLRSR